MSEGAGGDRGGAAKKGAAVRSAVRKGAERSALANARRVVREAGAAREDVVGRSAKSANAASVRGRIESDFQ